MKGLARLAALHELLGQLLPVLAGQGEPLHWNQAQRLAAQRTLARVGLHLVTRTGAHRLRYRLRRHAHPVASGFYGPPIKQHADLFLLELQAVPLLPRPRRAETPQAKEQLRLLREEALQKPNPPASPPPAKKEQLRLLREEEPGQRNSFSRPDEGQALTPSRPDEGQREIMR